MIALMHTCRRALLSALLLLPASPLRGEDCCDPSGPFRPGEAYAEQPATCETIGRWIERAPDVDRRITMTIHGALAAVESDGVLAYLIMCPEPGVQVMCVAYQTNGMQPGDVVTFAGGYARVGPNVAPAVIAAGLLLLGAWLAYEALSGGWRNAVPDEPDRRGEHRFHVNAFIWVSLGLFLQMVLIHRAGFVLAQAALFTCVARGFGSVK